MKLTDVLAGVTLADLGLLPDLEITGIAYSSKGVTPGALFAALKGEKADGMDFAGEAQDKGASAVLSEWPRPASARAAWVRVRDAREALALAAANFYGRPSDRMKVAGVTGTKGKTTITYILESVVRAAGGRPGVVGTIEYRFGGTSQKAPHTTPEAPDLQKVLRTMLDGGATHCLMEVSSHALEQKRVWGVSFDVAVFTNLSGEHLDYHGSMESYFEAKKKLFLLNHKRSASVVNSDDEWGRRLVSELPMRTITYGLGPDAIVRAVRFETTETGLRLGVSHPGGTLDLQSRLLGRHNVSNILGATAAALALGIEPREIAAGIAALPGVPGRFQAVPNARGLRIVVDYAHTDSAMRSLLETARELTPGRVIVVFGAGGNRDKAKRARMGDAAARLADWSVVTSDNPRLEDPLQIIADIEKGFQAAGSSAYEVVPDRREAIRRALSGARPGDSVLVAGKGHEDYQIFRDRTIHFSDIEEVESALRDMDAGRE